MCLNQGCWSARTSRERVTGDEMGGRAAGLGLKHVYALGHAFVYLRVDAYMIYTADTATPAEERERSEENNVVEEAGGTGSVLS